MARLNSSPTLRRLIAFALVAIALATFALLAGPSGRRAEADAKARPAGLHPIGSCDRLRAFLRHHQAAVIPYGVAGIGAEAGDIAGPSTGSPAPSTGSPTNVQEPGVDEPDVVKTVGSTILSVDGRKLRAVDASGATPRLAATVALPHAAGKGAPVSGYQLLGSGDRMLAIGTGFSYVLPNVESAGTPKGVAPGVIAPMTPHTVVAELDVSDPDAPRVLSTMTIEGDYVSARLVGSSVRLVSSSYPGHPIPQRGHGRALLPSATVHDATTGQTTTRPLFGCADVTRPSRFAGAGMLSVLTIDLPSGPAPVDVDTVLTDGDIVYGSQDSLYVATERWSSPSGRASRPGTEIHRFDTSAPDTTTYVASGSVRGYMLSQWSMSEQDGVLRVASTSTPPSGAGSGASSYVTDLAAAGDRLKQVGQVGGIGRGQQIYAVRFIGDTGYVVTYHQVDPLYVLDLSDPTTPALLGKLHIPGYSAYLHPVAPGLLLGIGRGAGGGVQASLFDVGDPANPVRLDRENFGGRTSTEVEYDHHAFSWFADASLAMVPLDVYGSVSSSSGAVGLRMTPGGANPLGRVARIPAPGGERHALARTVEIGGRVYAIGPRGVDAYDPAGLARVGELAYPHASR